MPAWCLYANYDREAAIACLAAEGDNYRKVEYPGSAHGMMLLGPNVQPSSMQLILDFLAEALGK